MDFFHVELDGELLAGMVDMFSGHSRDQAAGSGLEIDDGFRARSEISMVAVMGT